MSGYAPGMEARDFRGLGRAAQEALRRRALFLIEHEGMSQAQAARVVGVHRQTVTIWQRRSVSREGSPEIPAMTRSLSIALMASPKGAG